MNRDAVRRDAAAADARRYEARARELGDPADFDIASDYWRRAGDSTRAGLAADQAERMRRQ